MLSYRKSLPNEGTPPLRLKIAGGVFGAFRNSIQPYKSAVVLPPFFIFFSAFFSLADKAGFFFASLLLLCSLLISKLPSGKDRGQTTARWFCSVSAVATPARLRYCASSATVTEFTGVAERMIERFVAELGCPSDSTLGLSRLSW